MDPNATYHLIMTEDDPNVRIEACDNLLQWIRNEGFLPTELRGYGRAGAISLLRMKREYALRILSKQAKESKE